MQVAPLAGGTPDWTRGIRRITKPQRQRFAAPPLFSVIRSARTKKSRHLHQDEHRLLVLILDRAHTLSNDLCRALGGEKKSRLAKVILLHHELPQLAQRFSLAEKTHVRREEVLNTLLQIALALDRAQQPFNGLRRALLGGQKKSSYAMAILLQHVILKLALVQDHAQQLSNDLRRARGGEMKSSLAKVILLHHELMQLAHHFSFA